MVALIVWSSALVLTMALLVALDGRGPIPVGLRGGLLAARSRGLVYKT